ncbi:methyl-accepting chemotaxis protein [Vibrio sp. PP-XX7]
MKSIKHKSMLYLSGISLVVMIVTFTGGYLFAKNYFNHALEKQIHDANQTLSIVLKDAIFAYDKTLSSNIMGSFVTYPYIHEIKAFDHRGKPIGSSVEKVAAPEDSAELRAEQVDVIGESGKKIGYLEILYRMDANDKLLAMTRLMFIFISIIVLVALQVVNWFVLTHSVVRPIQIVANAMHDIAQGGGDLTRRLTISSRDEVGMLAQGFNDFISNMQSLIGRISASTNTLSDCSNQIQSKAGTNTTATQQQLAEVEQVATALNQMSSATRKFPTMPAQLQKKQRVVILSPYAAVK